MCRPDARWCWPTPRRSGSSRPRGCSWASRSDRRRAGLLLGLAGLILIFNPLAFDWSDRAAIFGNALVLLAALCWAANIVYVRAHRW